MDLSKLKAKIGTYANKYKYVIAIFLLGIALILIPTGKAKNEATQQITVQEEHIDQAALGKLLSRMQGAGRVEVLLSLQDTQATQYQQNQEGTGDSTGRMTTVTVTDADRNEAGLINKVCAPTYRGAIVLCDGADDPAVRLSIIEAVSNITGLRSNQITVLKMQ